MRGLAFLVTLVGLALAAPSARAATELASDTVDGPRPALGRHERDRDRLGWYVPDFAKLQVAGYLGTVGAGFGYAAFSDILNVSVFYGYTPSEGIGDAVHAAKLGIDFRPFELRKDDVRLVPIYLGVGGLYAFGGEYFTRLPERYRRHDPRYYPPTSVHWLLQAGLELDYVPRRGPFERHGLYFELVALDTYLFSYTENRKQLHVTDIASSSIGYRLAF